MLSKLISAFWQKFKYTIIEGVVIISGMIQVVHPTPSILYPYSVGIFMIVFGIWCIKNKDTF